MARALARHVCSGTPSSRERPIDLSAPLDGERIAADAEGNAARAATPCSERSAQFCSGCNHSAGETRARASHVERLRAMGAAGVDRHAAGAVVLREKVRATSGIAAYGDGNQRAGGEAPATARYGNRPYAAADGMPPRVRALGGRAAFPTATDVGVRERSWSRRPSACAIPPPSTGPLPAIRDLVDWRGSTAVT
jgi:hypothetical protein